MLTVTKAARECLSSRLERKEAADDVAMRFTHTKNGWRLRLDHVRPDDTSFSYEGRKVLLMDAAATKALAAATLEVRTTDAGVRLKLRRATGGGE